MFYAFGSLNSEIKKLEEITISPLDLGVQRGYSIFDFFKLIDLENPWLSWYLERFFNSMARVNIDHDWSPKSIKKQCQSVLQANNETSGYIKLIATRGISTNGFFATSYPTLLILALPIKPQKEHYYSKGARLLLTSYLRDIPEVKTTNYIQSAMLGEQMKKEDAVDVLYHNHGQISEASRSNFYIVKNLSLIHI